MEADTFVSRFSPHKGTEGRARCPRGRPAGSSEPEQGENGDALRGVAPATKRIGPRTSPRAPSSWVQLIDDRGCFPWVLVLPHTHRTALERKSPRVPLLPELKEQLRNSQRIKCHANAFVIVYALLLILAGKILTKF